MINIFLRMKQLFDVFHHIVWWCSIWQFVYINFILNFTMDMVFCALNYWISFVLTKFSANNCKMSQVELSNVVVEGLKSLNTVISADLTKKIISNAVKMALHSDASMELFWLPKCIFDRMWKCWATISILFFFSSEFHSQTFHRILKSMQQHQFIPNKRNIPFLRWCFWP